MNVSSKKIWQTIAGKLTQCATWTLLVKSSEYDQYSNGQGRQHVRSARKAPQKRPRSKPAVRWTLSLLKDFRNWSSESLSAREGGRSPGAERCWASKLLQARNADCSGLSTSI
ncbi:hypothetical protein KC335_g171 [Hortaea werneckii]|nr:hypothetical protein KC335_g171 [Hortaea werneckii]